MSAKQKSCVVVVCDGCKNEYTHDYTPHFDSLDEGREQTNECDEWWTDGADLDLCYHCKTKPHGFVPDKYSPDACGRCSIDKDEHGEAPEVAS